MAKLDRSGERSAVLSVFASVMSAFASHLTSPLYACARLRAEHHGDSGPALCRRYDGSATQRSSCDRLAGGCVLRPSARAQRSNLPIWSSPCDARRRCCRGPAERAGLVATTPIDMRKSLTAGRSGARVSRPRSAVRQPVRVPQPRRPPGEDSVVGPRRSGDLLQAAGARRVSIPTHGQAGDRDQPRATAEIAVGAQRQIESRGLIHRDLDWRDRQVAATTSR